MTGALADLMSGGGYIAVALLMFLENVFPPIPSEVVMPLAGAAAAKGTLSLWGVTLAGSLGSFAGAAFWFAIGYWVGTARLKRWTARNGRWLTLTPSDIEAGERWFAAWGGFAVLFGRLIPTVRTFISVPAGMARMNLVVFALFTAVGTVAWTALLAGAGYALKNGPAVVANALEPVSLVVIAIIAVIYIWRVINFVPERDANQGAGGQPR